MSGGAATGVAAAEPAPVLAHVVRGDLVESVHTGHLVGHGPDGARRLVAGDPDVVLWPRSTLKPLQAVAMLRAGLELPEHLLAVAAASHAGGPVHRDAVRAILALGGLDVTDLRNTPDLPLGAPERAAWLAAGNGPDRLTQNCSGKHAAMLLTCRVNGWDLATYLDVDHPLQRAVAATIRELAGPGAATHVTVDGCGAPLFSTTLDGLAHAYARLGAAAAGADAADPLGRVARAMEAHPELVAGEGRDATVLMRALPGTLVKDGADGVLAAGDAAGRGFAVKIADGAARPLRALALEALARLGTGDARDTVDPTPVLGGGLPVGAVVAHLEGAGA